MRKFLFSAALLLSLGLTGCVSLIHSAMTEGRHYLSKWDNQCLVLLQDVDFREGRRSSLGSKVSMLATKDAGSKTRGSYDFLKVVDQIPVGTQLRVARIYDHRQVWGGAPLWSWRVQVQVMQGVYQGLLINIPSVSSLDPRDNSLSSPQGFWISEALNRNPYNRNQLNPNTIMFDPKILRPCE